jgi:hypothetical protein
MNDEPTSDALTRASAYLDGELDAPESQAVEADPAVMAEVARLRAVQDAIRDVQEPSSQARDLAIDVALAEFDHIHQPVAAAIRIKPRPSYGRWMAVAAAIAGLAALGAVITATARGGGYDPDAPGAGAADQAAVAFDTDASDRQAPAASASALPQPEATLSQTMLSAVEPPASTAAAAGQAAAESAAATTTPAASGSDMFTQFDPNTPIPDEVELGRIGRLLLAEWRSGTRETKVGTPCDTTLPGAVLLSDAFVIVDGTTRNVLIAADPESDEAFALDPVSCAVVMTGR